MMGRWTRHVVRHPVRGGIELTTGAVVVTATCFADWWQVSVLVFYVAFGGWLVRRYGPTRDTARAPAEGAHSMRG